MITAAGCPVFLAKKDAYWMFARLPLRLVLFFVTLFTGITIAIGGKFVWKFTYFSTGFGLLLTIFMIILYPAYYRKGYRVNWELWICYPLSLVFSTAFGFFLTHYPKGGSFWLGGWIGYIVSSNCIYNLIFNFVANTHMIVYWCITIPSVLTVVFLVFKFKDKEDKTWHLIWQAPIFGGYLVAMSILIYVRNTPHSKDFAEIKAALGSGFEAGPGYLWALFTWAIIAALGFIGHKLIEKFLPMIKAKQGMQRKAT